MSKAAETTGKEDGEGLRSRDALALLPCLMTPLSASPVVASAGFPLDLLHVFFIS